MAIQAIVVALSSVLIWVISGTAEKEIAKILGNKEASFLILGAGVVPIVIYYLFFFSGQLDIASLVFSIISGIFFGIAALLYYKALETEEVSVSYSIGLFQPIILFAYSIVVLGENFNLYQALAGLIVLLGVLMIATKKHSRFDKKLIPVFLANIFWTIYWMFLSLGIIYSNQIGFPILISRVVGLLLVFGLYGQVITTVTRKRKVRIGRVPHILAIAIIAGILDGSANVIYSYLIVLKSLALGSLVSLLGPFFVVLLAYLIYKEKLTKVQILGLAIAAAGAFALVTV